MLSKRERMRYDNHVTLVLFFLFFFVFFFFCEKRYSFAIFGDYLLVFFTLRQRWRRSVCELIASLSDNLHSLNYAPLSCSHIYGSE